MAFTADHMAVLDRLEEELRLARAPMPRLFSKLVATVCIRLPLLNKSGQAARIEKLTSAGAWADAALLLLELEIPAWKLRRLVCQDGEWLCSLSRQPNLPIAFDEPVEATHEILPLAILRAFVEVRRSELPAAQSVARVPQVRPVPEQLICCDNFT